VKPAPTTRRRILLVAAAPALDRVAVVEDAARGGTLRALRAAEAPGGKAIHAARTAAALGGDVQLLLAVAGGAGRRLLRELREERLAAVVMRIAHGESRTTFTVVDAARGDVLEVLEPAPALTAGEADRLARRAASLARASGIVSFGGSVPPGAPVDLVARIVRAARRAGAFCSVDTSGEALAAAVAEGPDLVKPNLDEAAALLGAPQDSAEAAAERVLALGARAVLVTAGEHGAVLADGARVVRLIPPDGLRRVNAVGCGDALLGATLARLAAGDPLEEGAATGVAAAAEKLGRELPGAPDPARVAALRRRVRVERC
jgi:1-phosphofructokinase family hexose kinase